MQPFVWLVVSLLAGIGALVKLAAPTWLLILVGSLFGLLIICILAFAAVLVKRGHYYALLSERFNLGAMALGAQTFGNTENGSFQPSPSMLAPLPFEKVSKIIEVAPPHAPLAAPLAVKEQVDAR